jgi:CO dehydrogenase maturation factor
MSVQIAVAGKGGAGKTSFCALLIKYLVEKGKTPVLAVDADANANLNEALGFAIEKETVSELIAATKDPSKIPDGMTQDVFINYRLNAALSDGNDVDLLVMGGPEGPGCFCFPNNILRKYLDSLTKGYRYVVMDNEAGLEHISRRTTRDIDIMFVISDCSARSVRSAGRVRKLISEIDTKVKRTYLVLNKATPEDVQILSEEIEKTNLELVGLISPDPDVAEYDALGKALFDLPENSLAVMSLYEIMDTIQM